MTETSIPQTPKEAVEQITETFKDVANDFEAMQLDASVPESVRAFAEQTVTQARDAYERSKDAMEESIDAMERSFDAAGQGATAFNRKLIDIAQRNLNSGFDLAKNLASAKNIGEIVELQSEFVRNQFEVLANQASEIRALTTKIAADTTEPLKSQVSRSIEAARKNT